MEVGALSAKAYLGLKASFLDNDFVFCKLQKGKGKSIRFSTDEELILLSEVKKLIRL